jgi:phospho-N-acetylmuramoyl-pentapeptide-transferase
MLYHFLPQFADVHIIFNLFNFLTFRSVGAIVTSLLIAFVVGPATIRWLRELRVGEVVRSDGPEGHLHKAGTPTMGGALIVLSAAISTLLWAELTNWYVVLSLLAFLWMGAIGFMDDYLQVVRHRTKGLIARYKMIGQLSFGLALGAFLVLYPIWPVPPTWTMVPFFEAWVAVFWTPAYVVFVALVVAGTSNAVNLTDGLDGLAGGASAMVLATYVVIAFWQARLACAETPQPACYDVRDPLDLAVVAAAATGACIGFLWWNAAPAKIFMGDTGSLALGGLIAGLSVTSRTELLAIVIGGLFVVEMISVVLQIAVFRTTRRRLFRMAPFHHHFELAGWAETTVIIRFWLLAAVCCMFGLGLFYSEQLAAAGG